MNIISLYSFYSIKRTLINYKRISSASCCLLLVFRVPSRYKIIVVLLEKIFKFFCSSSLSNRFLRTVDFEVKVAVLRSTFWDFFPTILPFFSATKHLSQGRSLRSFWYNFYLGISDIENISSKISSKSLNLVFYFVLITSPTIKIK